MDLGLAFFLVALGEGVEPDDRRFGSKPTPSQWWASWGLGALRGMWSSAAGGEREREGGREGGRDINLVVKKPRSLWHNQVGKGWLHTTQHIVLHTTEEVGLC